MHGMSTQTQNRQPPGTPIGGQFAAHRRSGATFTLQSTDGSTEYLATLSPEDRALAERILNAPSDPFAPDDGQTQFEYLDSFGGYYEGEPEHEAAEIAARLATTEPDIAVKFSRNRDGDWEWTTSTYLGDGLNVSAAYTLEEATTDREAEGMDAALAYAKAITARIEDLRVKRDKLRSALAA